MHGPECKAIEGLGGLMSTMHAMRTEAASMLLPPQGCSTSGLVEHMQRAFCKECILGGDMRRMPAVRPIVNPACAQPCCAARLVR